MQAARKLEAYVPDDVVGVAAPPPDRGVVQWLKERLTSYFAAYFSRADRAPAGAQFVWSVPATKVGRVRPEQVYCVELPVSNPVQTLESYLKVGIAADHVVFVGDLLTMTDEAYRGITRMGALVHETPKKGRRRQTQEDLAAYFDSGGPAAVPTKNPNPYTYKPDQKVTPEQLQALVDALGRRR